ncbi:hypothetical protein [Piscinibacter sakaiensis]|uniref:preprotein translocase subunit SecA n=1 Tax=Piscinibacter sakaiensis TaxID=1547922 RepID=UPI003AABF83D
MTPTDIAIPGLLWGDYPERRVARKRLLQRCTDAARDLGDRVGGLCGPLLRRRDTRWLAAVRRSAAALANQTIAAALPDVIAGLRRHGLHGQALIDALALVAVAAERVLKLAPFDSQLLAARTVLNGQLAEMATGEGKTLAVALAAAVGALAGSPVHVITANDYLVGRDAERLQALYHALGLSVGRVIQPDGAARRSAAYACHITYVTAKELVFDYLRDGITGPATRRRRDAPSAALARLQPAAAAPAMLRGLCLAIVDEADAILIDEARVPLILSRRADDANDERQIRQALVLARRLVEDDDYRLEPETMRAELTDSGRERLERAATELVDRIARAAWRHRVHREHAVVTALAALHLYHADRHYLVRDGKVQIIDETTGRVAEGRVWSKGLQQFIEIKEGCQPSPTMATLAQLTYQRFFPRYVRLGGLSGTLREARSELMSTYGRSVRRIPLRRPDQRRAGPARLFRNHEDLWQAVGERVAALHQAGRPVLLATDSVAEAQAAADRLAARGLPHAVLHARNDLEEACVIAQAGQAGAITVTTNLSGRGTDIELGDGVAALGGLHVMCCQLNSARRIDRQLAGRAARQGDPGSVETMLSLDTALLKRALPAPLRTLLRPLAPTLPSWTVHALARWPQAAEEFRHRVERRRLIDHDERTERQLGFAGIAE